MNLPWKQRDSLSPVYDSAGKLVSFPQNAEFIVKSVNQAGEAANLLERLAKVIAEATGPTASVTGTIQLTLLAPYCAVLAKRLRDTKPALVQSGDSQTAMGALLGRADEVGVINGVRFIDSTAPSEVEPVCDGPEDDDERYH